MRLCGALFSGKAHAFFFRRCLFWLATQTTLAITRSSNDVSSTLPLCPQRDVQNNSSGQKLGTCSMTKSHLNLA
jgi:hypothetical protein